MSMKKIPYGRQSISDQDIQAVVETLHSDYLTQGPKVKEFEDAFSKYVGSKYALAVCNATAGLHISVLALGLKKGDRVITTPISFAATANCIRYAGAEVWFADIDADSYLLSIESVKSLIESKPKGFFKGVIPVDFAGLPVNLEEFRALANEHGLWIVEDACHAPGGSFIDSKDENQRCGNGKYADLAVFSFHPVKHIACGEGGMVTTNSKKLYEKLLLLRTHGISKNNLTDNEGGWFYEMTELGFNYRLTDFQSALGISQLLKNKDGVIKRNQIASKFKSAFKGKLKFQSLPNGSFNAYHLFVIEVCDRKLMYDYLHKSGILAQIHYIPIHMLPYYKKIGYQGAKLTNAEKYYTQTISLPMYPTLTEDEQQYVIDKVLMFQSKMSI